MHDVDAPTAFGGQHEPGATTGAYLVAFEPGAMGEGIRTLQAEAGLSVASAGDFSAGAVESAALAGGDALVFEALSCAVVDPDDEERMGAFRVAGSESDAFAVIEPERVVYATQGPETVSMDYLRGYRDAIVRLVDDVTGGEAAGAAGAMSAAAATWSDESQTTWGLQAIRATESCLTGRDVCIAVLDTGFEPGHQDYAGRVVEMRSFVDGEDAVDGHGHGTHCIGTACGGSQPVTLPRYGVACDARIHVGKVLSNAGVGADRGILAGINWAVTSGCKVVSMSLGAPVAVGEAHSRVFETAARRALRAGTVIVAAAGNDSRRSAGVIKPVSHPANCPSILAVGAIDRRLRVADFSNRGLNPKGGQVDVVAPGVDVHSSIPGTRPYARFNGTSMATPHVAGVLALLIESDPDATAGELVARIGQTARRLPLPSSDVGSGLVQAPRR